MKMNMKFLAAAALTLVSSAGLRAQATKIAVIDMQAAITNTKEGQAQIAELQKKYGPKEQDLQKRGQEIQSKQDQLKKTQNTISDAARADLENEIKKLTTSLQRDGDDAQADSEADQQAMLQTIGGKLVQVITKYAQDHQIQIVFDLSSSPNNLVCCSSANDITRDVIALYDTTNPATGAAAAPVVRPPAASVPRPPAATTPRAPATTPAKPPVK
jgi:outer membrane protein